MPKQKKKHKITLNYSTERSLESFQFMLAELMFLPYQTGKKYEQSKEVTAKIPILQMLLEDKFKKVFDFYLELLNEDLNGLGQLMDTIVTKMEEKGQGKYEITVQIEKV